MYYTCECVCALPNIIVLAYVVQCVTDCQFVYFLITLHTHTVRQIFIHTTTVG